jgi:hypothetical protein
MFLVLLLSPMGNWSNKLNEKRNYLKSPILNISSDLAAAIKHVFILGRFMN